MNERKEKNDVEQDGESRWQMRQEKETKEREGVVTAPTRVTKVGRLQSLSPPLFLSPSPSLFLSLPLSPSPSPSPSPSLFLSPSPSPSVAPPTYQPS